MKRILRPLLMAALLVAGIHVFAQNHTYVDLGLPSGTLWATCNVGANTPEEYGDYFAWGETSTKTTYDWSTYKYCNGGDGSNTLTKYCHNAGKGYNGFTDDLTTLLPKDDAAAVLWGSGWCMPTVEQWEELSDNTICVWTTQNGVDGMLFSASNGNSIFLPAAGYRWDVLDDAGGAGYYWSNSLYPDRPNFAWSFYFYWDDYYTNNDSRYCGFPIRPVRSSR